jgi:hypothetical protein
VPRILAAGIVAAHGGHGDVHGNRQEILDLFRPTTLCSGADDCARAVRQAVQQGADVIKTASTGGVMSDTAAGLGQQMSDAELVSIVETAHRLGRKVAAYAHGTDGVNAALRAGVDSVEHGTYLDAESLRLFKAKGGYLVPALLAGDTVTRQADTAEWMPATVRAKARIVGPLMIDADRRDPRGHGPGRHPCRAGQGGRLDCPRQSGGHRCGQGRSAGGHSCARNHGFLGSFTVPSPRPSLRRVPARHSWRAGWPLSRRTIDFRPV